MNAKGGVKKQKEEDDKWVSYNYSGPKDLLGLFPPVSISFCNEEKDTLYLQPPINKPESLTTITASAVTKAYTVDHTGYLAMLFLKATEEAANEGKDLALQMIALYSAADHLETPTGNATLDKLQSEYNLSVKSKELQDKMSTAINRNALMVLFNAQNNNELIVDAETSPSHTVDEFAVKGKVKIRIVHDPAPY
jgi:hypothetical protein